MKNDKRICTACLTGKSGLCAALAENCATEKHRHKRSDGHLSANLYLQRKDDCSSNIKVVTSGWAGIVQNTESGHRLITNFILPGDVIGSGVWMKGSPFVSVQAISDVTYCAFEPESVLDASHFDPDILRVLIGIIADYSDQHQRRMFDIAKRDAEERILSLLLGLYERLEARGMAEDGIMQFPLRQRHLADATGLTQVHVSRVLRKLREDDVMVLDRKVLTFNRLDLIRDRLT